MTTKILTEKSRATQVEAITKSGEYEYSVDYKFLNNELIRLQCTIEKVEKKDGIESRNSCGYMALENGNKSMNFPVDVDALPHITMFDSIVKEVKASLSSE